MVDDSRIYLGIEKWPADGTIANFAVVRRIAEGTGLVVDVGGGIRDLARIESYLDEHQG